MKRLLLTIAAVASVAAPMALSATDASAQDRGRWDHRDDRRGRDDHRGGRYDGRWDQGRHNGYYYNNRWSYGPPPPAYYGRPGFRPGYTAWSRGAYLPPVYRDYVVRDYYRYHLRPPPRGYTWYRVDDDYLLASATTGLIFDIINSR